MKNYNNTGDLRKTFFLQQHICFTAVLQLHFYQQKHFVLQ